jgi:hypothetical protein
MFEGPKERFRKPELRFRGWTMDAWRPKQIDRSSSHILG